MDIDINKAKSITDFSKKLIEQIIERVESMNYVKGILYDMLDSVVSFHAEPEDKEVEAFHNISNLSINSDIFLSDLSEETHSPPNKSDYWLLDKIKENQPDYFSPDIY